MAVSDPLSRTTPISPRPAHTRPSHLRVRNRPHRCSSRTPGRNHLRGRNHPHPVINIPPQHRPPARTGTTYRPHTREPPDPHRPSPPPPPPPPPDDNAP